MNNTDIANLKGSSLKAKAAELDIPGRSKMNADELRVAIANRYAQENTRKRAEETGMESAQIPDVEVSNASLLRRVTSNVLGSAAPMTSAARGEAYFATNGTRRLTPKQAKRNKKKFNKNGR